MLFSRSLEGRFSRRSLCSSGWHKAGWHKAGWPGCVWALLLLQGCLDMGCSAQTGFGGASLKQDTCLGPPQTPFINTLTFTGCSVFGFHQINCSITACGALGLFWFFLRALCVRSFEMFLHRHSTLELDEELFLTFQALCSLFSPYNSAPGTAWEQFSPEDLLALLLQLSILAFSCDLLFRLAALGQQSKGSSCHLGSTSAPVWMPLWVCSAVAPRLLSCCQPTPLDVKCRLCPNFGWQQKE